MDARDNQRTALSDRIWHHSTEFLNRFFEKEKKRGMQKEWMSFFRSEKYPDEGSVLEKAKAFRKRNHSVISLEQLMEASLRWKFFKQLLCGFPGVYNANVILQVSQKTTILAKVVFQTISSTAPRNSFMRYNKLLI